MASANRDLDWYHVSCKDLASILDGGVIVFNQIIGNGEGQENLYNGTEIHCSQNDLSYRCWGDQDLLLKIEKGGC